MRIPAQRPRPMTTAGRSARLLRGWQRPMTARPGAPFDPVRRTRRGLTPASELVRRPGSGIGPFRVAQRAVTSDPGSVRRVPEAYRALDWLARRPLRLPRVGSQRRGHATARTRRRRTAPGPTGRRSVQLQAVTRSAARSCHQTALGPPPTTPGQSAGTYDRAPPARWAAAVNSGYVGFVGRAPRRAAPIGPASTGSSPSRCDPDSRPTTRPPLLRSVRPTKPEETRLFAAWCVYTRPYE
jgi:hypothetical protein